VRVRAADARAGLAALQPASADVVVSDVFAGARTPAHLTSVEYAAEAHRVLRPGGVLVVNLPAYRWLSSAHDVRVHNARRFTAGEARSLLAAAGFAGVLARYWNALLFPLMVVQRKVLARGAGGRSDVAVPPAWLNGGLHAVTALERKAAAAGLPYPVGGSVLATAVRP
jgi:SAM-dependent methyltransferase